jgi:pimeloyl-ACP methyl ester carboxylesterase
MGEHVEGSATRLPAAVDRALEAPGEAEHTTVQGAGIPFHVRSWGAPNAPPLLLLHGVTSSSRVWWRVGPALGAAGVRVHAPDLPGHGLTQSWREHWRFRDNARDVAELATVLGIATPGLRVVGHSWGAMTAAALPAVGLVPDRLVLLDPPAIPLAAITPMLDDPVEHHYDDLDEAIAAIRTANPSWSEGDVLAKAEALTQFDEPAVRDVITRNGDWDGGLADLTDPAAAGIDRWMIRGDPETGGLVPDAAVPAFWAAIGADRVLTIAGSPHSPQRTHPRETVAALLLALGLPDDPDRIRSEWSEPAAISSDGSPPPA